jgi:hypothetical protein
VLTAHRFRVLLGVAVVVGVVAFAAHAASQPPAPGRYISWAPPAAATATPGVGEAIPLASSPPVADLGPLAGLTSPLSGLFKQLNANTKATESGQYSIIQALEAAVADHIRQFLTWVTGGG